MNDSASAPQPAADQTSPSAAEAARSFADYVFAVLEEKRAEDIVRLDVTGVTDIADEFLIATMTNSRQGSAIVDACEIERKKRGLTRLGAEGLDGSSWIVLDYGDLVLHLFLPEQRAYYALEHLWSDAKRI